MEKVDLTNYELTKEVEGLKFYEYIDNDSVIILNSKDEKIAEINASCSMGYAGLDLITKD